MLNLHMVKELPVLLQICGTTRTNTGIFDRYISINPWDFIVITSFSAN